MGTNTSPSPNIMPTKDSDKYKLVELRIFNELCMQEKNELIQEKKDIIENNKDVLKDLNFLLDNFYAYYNEQRPHAKMLKGHALKEA